MSYVLNYVLPKFMHCSLDLQHDCVSRQTLNMLLRIDEIAQVISLSCMDDVLVRRRDTGMCTVKRHVKTKEVDICEPRNTCTGN
jgi:hypothetical protein